MKPCNRAFLFLPFCMVQGDRDLGLVPLKLSVSSPGSRVACPSSLAPWFCMASCKALRSLSRRCPKSAKVGTNEIPGLCQGKFLGKLILLL